MKKKLLSILTLLLCLCTGAWAESITVTWLPKNMTEITNAGTANVANILTVNDLSYSSDLNDPKLVTYQSNTFGNFVPKTAAGKNTYSKDDYIIFSVTVATGYVFYPKNATVKACGAGTGDNGAQIFATKQSSNGSNSIANSGKSPYTTTLSLNNFSAESYEEGNTLYFYVHVGTRGNTSPIKGVALSEVTLTGDYAAAGLTKLSTPSIEINQTTGEVTIGSVEHALRVTYTTDGTDPTASSTTYNGSFTVNENCTIKAIAIGDNTSYSNSNIASLAANITVADPVITAHNGTVGITCATEGATIKYSVDNETWETYTQPLTFLANTTIYAKAEHDSYKNNSGTIALAIDAAPAATTGSQTKILGFVTPGENNWEYMTADGTNYGINGKSDTDEEGWSLWISPNGSGTYDKGISGDGGTSSTFIIGGNSYQYIKNSNGRQFNIGMPSNLRANRITIYSWNNANGTTIWSNVGGTTYTTDTEVPIVSQSGATPETRVFELNDIADNISLNNAGYQQCFIVAVDYTTYIPGPAEAEVAEFDLAATITYAGGSLSSNTWTGTADTAQEGYTLSASKLSQKNSTGFFKMEPGTYTIGVPAGVAISKFAVDAYGENSGAVLTYGATSNTWTVTDAENSVENTYIVTSPIAGGSILFSTSTKNLIVKSIKLYTASTITLTTTDNMAGWRAFYDASQGYTVDEGTKVFVAPNGPVDDVVTFTKIDAIPAGTAVVLYHEDKTDSHKMTLTKAEVDSYEGVNLLKWTTSAVENKYRLGYGASGVGFYPYSGTPASGAVYLDVSSVSEARALTFAFDEGTTTGISSTRNDMTNDNVVYDLQGRKINGQWSSQRHTLKERMVNGQLPKGLYIVNGKKVVVK